MSTIEARLAAPARRLTPEELASTWFVACAGLRVAGSGVLATDWRFLGKLRGALGEVLRRSASDDAIAGRPCPWSHPCGLDVLFRCQGHMTGALEIPKPLLISADAVGGDLIVRIQLVGFASDWLEEALAAMVLAVRERLRPLRGREIVDRSVHVFEAIETPRPADEVILRFVTPLEIAFRNGAPAHPRDAIRSLILSMGNRVSGMARWQDAEIEADWKGIAEDAIGLDVSVLGETSDDWRRYSRRQQRWIPMKGDRPVLLLRGNLDRIAPLLALAQTVHAGRHASLGMGRFDLLSPDESTIAPDLSWV